MIDWICLNAPFDEWEIKRFRVGGVWWVRLYRSGKYVAQFRQGKKYLVHYITGKRFASIEASVRYYIRAEGDG